MILGRKSRTVPEVTLDRGGGASMKEYRAHRDPKGKAQPAIRG